MSNHTPSPPFAKNHLMGFEMDHDYVPKEGDIYKNIHNNRIVMITEKFISDTGTIFYGIKSFNDGKVNDKEMVDYNTAKTMRIHWERIRDDEE